MYKILWIGISMATILSGCIEEDIRRLQTDQSFEGEEAYLISSLLDEHLFLLWQPFSFYSDSTKIAAIPGCPIVQLDIAKNEVILNFDGVVCVQQQGKRSGRLVLHYTPLPITQGYRLLVTYLNYTYEGNRLTGSRTLTIIAQNRDRRVFSDVSTDLLIHAKNSSSSRIVFNLSHTLSIAADQIVRGTSAGGGEGRNWVGREMQWEIKEPKQFTAECLNKYRARPGLGQETWTVTRSGTTNVVHLLTFFGEPECTTHTIIRLHEGVEMKKAP
jgi:hypothetical protein